MLAVNKTMPKKLPVPRTSQPMLPTSTQLKTAPQSSTLNRRKPRIVSHFQRIRARSQALSVSRRRSALDGRWWGSSANGVEGRRAPSRASERGYVDSSEARIVCGWGGGDVCEMTVTGGADALVVEFDSVLPSRGGGGGGPGVSGGGGGRSGEPSLSNAVHGTAGRCW